MCATFDIEMMARDIEIELHVVEAADGGALVFDPNILGERGLLLIVERLHCQQICFRF